MLLLKRVGLQRMRWVQENSDEETLRRMHLIFYLADSSRALESTHSDPTPAPPTHLQIHLHDARPSCR